MGDGPQYYFVLKADNHEVIATSEMYSSKQACQTGIASVQRNGPTTDIRDETI
ncbi:YegP family protein [Pantoea stewartii]|nr:YegP family protein [Pantoea stewartii]MDF7787817.1 YegP family protein [Pantoea stewartii]